MKGYNAVEKKNGDIIRSSGNTDGIILESIGKATQRPGINVVVHDTFLSQPALKGQKLELLKNRVGMLAGKLSLEKIRIFIKDKDVQIRSEFYGSIEPKWITDRTWAWEDATKEDWDDVIDRGKLWVVQRW